MPTLRLSWYDEDVEAYDHKTVPAEVWQLDIDTALIENALFPHQVLKDQAELLASRLEAWKRMVGNAETSEGGLQ